jgi:hypothetical protein
MINGVAGIHVLPTVAQLQQGYEYRTGRKNNSLTRDEMPAIDTGIFPHAGELRTDFRE